MTDHIESEGTPAFKDRKIGLVVFGVLQAVLGGVCALLVPLMIFGMVASASLNRAATTPVDVRMMIPGILIYLLLAAWFISMGIGSIMARRWARALVLTSSWIWLISGMGGLVGALVFLPGMFKQMAESGQLPEGMVVVMEWVMTGFMAVFGVIMPGVLVIFYGSKNVRATCEFRDARVRWTDKCPLLVLAMSLMLGIWAVSMLGMGLGMSPIPFFGYPLSGWAGAGVSLVFMLLFGYAALGIYRLSIKAWWCAVLLTVAYSLSTGITFWRVGLVGFYEHMNLPSQQIDMARQLSSGQQGVMMAVFGGLWFVGLVGCLLYMKRYFTNPPKQGNAC